MSRTAYTSPYHAPAGPNAVSGGALRGTHVLLTNMSNRSGVRSVEDTASFGRELGRELEARLLGAGALLVTHHLQPHDLTLSLEAETGVYGVIEAVTLRADAPGRRVALAQVTQADRRAARTPAGLARLLIERLDYDPALKTYLASIQPHVPEPPLATAPPALAKPFVPGAPQPTAYVVAIGVEQYRDLPAPTGARRDAERFAALATSSLGVPKTHVHLLVDAQATRASVARELEWIAQSVPQGGRIYFYFGGHGAPDPSEGSTYLVPHDGDPQYLAATALSIAYVTERLSRSHAREAFVLLDACFSGTGGRSVLASGTRPLIAVKTQQATAQVVVFSASSGTEISGAAPDGQGGLFTTLLVDAIGTGAADLDGNGQISLQELEDWLAPRVTRAAQRDGRSQTPSLVVGPALGSAESVILAWGYPQQ